MIYSTTIWGGAQAWRIVFAPLCYSLVVFRQSLTRSASAEHLRLSEGRKDTLLVCFSFRPAISAGVQLQVGSNHGPPSSYLPLVPPTPYCNVIFFLLAAFLLLKLVPPSLPRPFWLRCCRTLRRRDGTTREWISRTSTTRTRVTGTGMGKLTGGQGMCL